MKPAYGFASHDLSSLRVFLIMLEYLHIRDLALISDMELEFASGMNVLTGETGAGKSFILKALNFLMGERLGADMVRPGKERAQVEALFMRSGEELIVRRELIAETGRKKPSRNCEPPFSSIRASMGSRNCSSRIFRPS